MRAVRSTLTHNPTQAANSSFALASLARSGAAKVPMWNPDGARWRAMPATFAKKWKAKAKSSRKVATVLNLLTIVAIKVVLPMLISKQ
jgi:hypothetical protein